MKSVVGLITFCCLITTEVLAIPDGFLLSVEPDCGSNTKSPAKVTVISDLSFKVVYTCDGGVVKEIAAKDDSTKVTFDASYSPFKKGSSDCHFMTASDTGIYRIFVDVYWSRTGSKYVIAHNEQYVVTCTSNPTAVDQTSVEHPMEESKFSPSVLHQHHETLSVKDTLRLVLMDVNGRHITSPEIITPGKKLRLLAMRDPVGSLGKEEKEEENENDDYEEVIKVSKEDISKDFPPGLLPIDCKVSDKYNRNYQILRGGCGDGGVIPHNKGFYTFWGRSISPIFEFFQLQGAEDLQFTCTFIFCVKRCDGNSCELDKRRRRGTEMGSKRHQWPKGRVMNVTLVLRADDKDRNYVKPVIKAQTSNYILQSGKSADNRPTNQQHNPYQTNSRNDGAKPVNGRHVVVGYITPRKTGHRLHKEMAMDNRDQDWYPLNADPGTDHDVSEENERENGDTSRQLVPWILAYVFCLLTAVLIAFWKYVKLNQV